MPSLFRRLRRVGTDSDICERKEQLSAVAHHGSKIVKKKSILLAMVSVNKAYRRFIMSKEICILNWKCLQYFKNRVKFVFNFYDLN